MVLADTCAQRFDDADGLFNDLVACVRAPRVCSTRAIPRSVAASPLRSTNARLSSGPH